MDATVQIFTEDGGRGSGFYIGNGQIMTAFHVVSDLNQRTFYSFNDVLHELTMVKYNEETDLAIMKMKIPVSLPILKIASHIPEVGDKLYTIGYHFGHPALKVASNGYVTALCDYEGRQRDYMFFDAPINRGASGGPVINDRGEVIGVNQMIFTKTGDWSGIGLSIRLSHIHWFMK
jgi:serine protease Do